MARATVAGLVRVYNDGLCSDEPRGVAYPGVPSVDEVLEACNLRPDEGITEDQWFEVCEFLDPEEE